MIKIFVAVVAFCAIARAGFLMNNSAPYTNAGMHGDDLLMFLNGAIGVTAVYLLGWV